VLNLAPGHASLYAKHPDKPASVRIAYHTGHDAVVGFNMVGSRWDHQVLANWVGERRSPAYCWQHLQQAQFDVEFGRVAFETMTAPTLPSASKGV